MINEFAKISHLEILNSSTKLIPTVDQIISIIYQNIILELKIVIYNNHTLPQGYFLNKINLALLAIIAISRRLQVHTYY